MDISQAINNEFEENRVGSRVVDSIEFKTFPEQITLSYLLEPYFDKKQLQSIAGELEIDALRSSQDATIFASDLNDAGASAIVELAYILQECEKREESKIDVHLSLSSKFYQEISKLRALRSLFEELYPSKKMNIIAQSAFREQTILNPWANMLRNSSSFFSAVVGGADEFSITGFDYAFSVLNKRTPQVKSIRQAINMAHVILKESDLKFVMDPMKGSFVIEKKTSELKDQVKKLLNKKLTKDEILKRCEENKQQLVRDLHTREFIMTGINDYANLKEDLVATYDCESINIESNGNSYKRLSEDLEKLRLETQLKQIKIDLYVHGPAHKIAPRKTFCQNYFEVAGLEVNTIYDLKDSQNQFLCICALDDEIQSIKFDEEKYKKVFISGKEKISEKSQNIFAGQNIFEVLSFFKEVQK